MNTLEWLKELALAPGVSGFESAVKKLLSKNLTDICDEDHDGIGSIIFSLKGKEKGPKVMIAAHMDEVGFMVKHITPEGYLKFTCIGGWWDQVLLG
ncbi:MAG: peptidase M28, partial [Selenomonadales bacterium]|nr:peptidase M28 [Selenomonadales bacterium]